MIGGVEQQVCVNLSAANVVRVPGQSYCEPIFDSLLCWVATPVNTQTDHICPIRNVPEHIRAYKNCSSDGNWSKTDYEACIAYINNMTANDTVQQPVVGDIDEYEYRIVRVMTDIYFIFSIISLLFLLISIFIFIYFRSLHCHRIKIHIHMFISFVIKFVIIIVMVEPGVTKRSSGSFQDVDWLCKTLVSLNYYGNTANMYWMFVEGLYLHNQIAAAVFSTDAPFKLFCFIGWGVPGIIVVAWSVIMQLTYKRPCWKDYSQSNWIYLVLVPFLLVIFVNLLFLINIIRILVTKLRSNNTDESSRIKKTIRATIILMPLLGLTNVLFLVNPEDRSSFQLAYHITNAILQSTGGIMLSVLYCFLNGEVQRVIKQKWTRFNIQRHLKRGGRLRSSRNSSFMLSQTEVTENVSYPYLLQTVIGTSTSSENNTCVNVNNNRYQKVATIIPEEDLVENSINDMENSVGNSLNDIENSEGNHVNDTENTVENYVTKVEKTVNNHVNNVEKNRLNNVEDSIILPSAESFDNLEESII